MQFICHCFCDEWTDPREDIYALEDGRSIKGWQESPPLGGA